MTVYTVTGLDSTGATDVTSALLAFIASCADGASNASRNTIEFTAGGTYRVDGTIAITDRNNLTFDANGCTFQTDVDADNSRSHWSLTGCTNIDLVDIVVRGANENGGASDAAYVAALEAQHAFSVRSCTNVRIAGCTASKVYGDWLYAGVSGGGVTDGLLVENCTFSDNGRQGFGLVGCANVEIRNNTTGACRRSLIDLEPNNALEGCDTVWIHDNTFGYARLSFIASKGYPGPVHNVTIEDNTVAATMVSEINPTGFNLRDNWIIRNNVADTAFGSAARAVMRFYKTTNLTVTGNTQPMQAGRDMHLCGLYDCTTFDVSGNTLANATGQYFESNTPDPGVDPTGSTRHVTSPSVVGSSTATATSATLTLSVPSGAQAGDMLFACVGHQGTDFASLLNGWEIVNGIALPASGATIWPFYVLRRILAAETSFVFTFPEGDFTNRSAGLMVAVRGAVDPYIDDTKSLMSSSAGAVIDTPGVTSSRPGSLVLYFACQRGGNGVITPDTAVTSVATVRNNSANGVALHCSSTVYTGAGTGRSRTFLSTNVFAFGGMTVATPGVSKRPLTIAATTT